MIFCSKMNIRILLILIFTTCDILFAQGDQKIRAIPRDISFTIKNTNDRITLSYPNAKLVSSVLPQVDKAIKNITYVNYGNRILHLDLFVAKKKSKELLPAVILIHGGGWRSGDRSMEWPMAEHLAARGYVTVTVEYRLSVEALYPAAIYDLKTAVKWIRENSLKYGIDSSKIAAYGCSSGGQLAAFLGTTGDMKKFEANEQYSTHLSNVQAVIDIDGIVDFTTGEENGKDNDPSKPSAGKLWFGASYKEKPELWEEASPINYVSKKSPPILFINSSLPRYHAGRDDMIAKLNHYNIYSEVHTIKDTPHTFWLFHPWFDETLEYIVKFLDKIFKWK